MAVISWGAELYICRDCEAISFRDELHVRDDGETFSRCSSVGVCPACGGDVDEAEECRKCGTPDGRENILCHDGLCSTCYEGLYSIDGETPLSALLHRVSN